MKLPIKTSTIGLTGILPAILASTCCVTPLLAVAGALGVSAGTLTILSALKPYLIGLSLLLITVGIIRAFRPKSTCGCHEAGDPGEDHPSRKSYQTGRLWIVGAAIITIVVLAWLYLAGGTAKDTQPSKASVKLESESFTLAGFDEECCVSLVELSLKEVEGYHHCAADLGTQKITVWFDSTKTNSNALADAINVTDYKVTSAPSDAVSAKSAN